jgi:hypothetical protein
MKNYKSHVAKIKISVFKNGALYCVILTFVLQLWPLIHGRYRRLVVQFVHLRLDERLLVGRFWFDRGQTVLVGVLHDANGDFDRTRLDGLKWWVQTAHLQIGVGDQIGQRL